MYFTSSSPASSICGLNSVWSREGEKKKKKMIQYGEIEGIESEYFEIILLCFNIFARKEKDF
jgi:hypothetical protein